MKLIHYKNPRKNFGDDLNEWLWDDILPEWRDWDDSISLVGVGTILNAKFLPAGKKIVLGSGVGYGEVPVVSDKLTWDIRCVRGPKTAKALGLREDAAICDPAMLIPLISRFRNIDRGNSIVFVPHIGSDSMYDWSNICNKIGIEYQSPCVDSEIVIRKLASAKYVIAESMHAAIIADAFSTPWRAVSINGGFNHFKWSDWAESLGIENNEIHNFFPFLKRMKSNLSRKSGTVTANTKPKPLNQVPGKKGKLLAVLAEHHLKLAMRGPFQLSDRRVLANCQERFLSTLDGVRQTYG